jgi:tetratricopeptide (TPR) repeat protein
VGESFSTLKKVAQLKPEQLNPEDAKSYAWHPISLGYGLKARGRVDDAVEAFRIGIQFDPTIVDWVNEKIYRAYAQAGRWADALEVNQQSIESDPENSVRWLGKAASLIQSGDEAGYREHCRLMVEHFPAAKGAGNALVTCKACCLLPAAIDLEQLPLEPLAQSLDQETFEAWIWPWGWQARALVAYRKGDAEGALKYIQQSENSGPDERAHAFNLAVRALTQLKLANVDEARLDMERASKAIDALRDSDFYDALMAGILLREAEAKLATVK